MKLQLNDSTKAIITAITTEVKRAASFDDNKAEYFYYILINGLELRYYGENRRVISQRDFNKLLLKGAKKLYEPLPLTEEEQGWADGTAADCANPKMHGHIVYSILDNQGGSGVYVWDYYQQKTVLKNELTPKQCYKNFKALEKLEHYDCDQNQSTEFKSESKIS